MKKSPRRSRRHAGGVLGLLGGLILGFMGVAGVWAHEGRPVGEFQVVVGFLDEPAIQGELNGLDLQVTRGDQPVEGLADTVQAEVILGEARRPLALTPVFDESGSYRAIFIPSQPGDYTFRLTGDLAGTPIDEEFVAGPETFASVEPRADYEFPPPSAASRGAVAVPALVGGVVLALGVAGLVLHKRGARG